VTPTAQQLTNASRYGNAFSVSGPVVERFEAIAISRGSSGAGVM
jgi:hypothetical protein